MIFGITKKIFIRLSNGLVNNQRKCISLSNQNFEIQPTLINIYPNEYSQELHSYPFAVKLNTCVGSDLSNKLCVLNKTEYLNLCLFNMITGMDESKTLTKHISYKCKCKFDGRKCNPNQKWNNDKCQ